MNLQLYGVYENNLNAKNVDIVDLWFPISGTPDAVKRPKQVAFFENLKDDLEFPKENFDLILSNPPWLPANYVSEQSSLDNAVFDPNEKFLHSSLNFAKFHMHVNDGDMLLVYSDLAQNLGI